MKILITAGTTAQAHKLKRLLNRGEVFVFADQEAMPAFMSQHSRFVQIPSGNSFSFAHELLKCCLDLDIRQVFPLRKDEMLSLSEAVHLFNEYGIRLMIPPKHHVEKLFHQFPVKGKLVVVKDGKVDVAEDTILDVPAMYDGVYLVDPLDSHNYQLFTADK